MPNNVQTKLRHFMSASQSRVPSVPSRHVPHPTITRRRPPSMGNVLRTRFGKTEFPQHPSSVEVERGRGSTRRSVERAANEEGRSSVLFEFLVAANHILP